MESDVGPGVLALNADIGTSTSKNIADNLFHATTNLKAANGVWSGIDSEFFNPLARFGRAFYVAEHPGTTIAELAHHGSQATHRIHFSVNSSAARVLDLSKSEVAKAWNYSGGEVSFATRAIGERAKAAGFNAIRYKSLRGPGHNLAILEDYNDILTPQMMGPIQ